MATRYLTVTGFIPDDGTLVLDTGFLMEQAPVGSIADVITADALVVESYDGRGIVRRDPVATSPLCLHDVPTFAQRFVAGVVPFAPETRRLRFIYQDRVLREMDIPRNAPVLELTWQPVAEVAGVHSVRWQADHPDGEPLSFIVLYSPSADEWQAVSLTQRENFAVVDFDALPGGESCRVRVLASDGANTTAVNSQPFQVPRKGLRPFIVYPDDGATVTAGVPILLDGQAFHWEDPEREADTMTWRSSVDGQLGEGNRIDAALSPGLHEIVLTVESGDDRGEAFVAVTALPTFVEEA
jgi:hypothetical protein